MKSRLERARKMNEAMKTLIDKEPSEVQQKLTQIERVREKLLIENKDLQEELKLREDSLFDQDDELEKRNAELAKLKRTLEQLKSELEENKAELSKVKTQDAGSYSSKLSAQIADNEKLREELSEKVRGLGGRSECISAYLVDVQLKAFFAYILRNGVSSK
ncbi:unnamed protein product [Dibothriocephalus latus]|uniref:Uncharacterized protein n=1 Tax=Dibothriocephalus latus TaxID=60516 RepID=A0A3P7P7Q6_DIBLA|nr:unnamed protein product [Dibothriocephalus latus]